MVKYLNFKTLYLAASIVVLTGCPQDKGECNFRQERACGLEVGACRKGWQLCDRDGNWGECLGSVNPTDEMCDGIDNDCNGIVDDLIAECENACGDKGVNICSFGTWYCDSLTPLESCGDGVDNDCDGGTDEGCNCTLGEKRSCGSDVGDCQSGEQYCKDAIWTICQGGKAANSESCDGRDNDCDGQVDEELSRECSTVCGRGTQVCQNGQWLACDAPQPTQEVEDGIDNDCDGYIDEGFTETVRPCGKDTGECVAGTETLDENGQWGPCIGSIGPLPEVCDSLDNNCDGVVDNELAQHCTVECSLGSTRCVNGQWTECDAPGPSAEVCNGRDDDCDGQTDEGLADKPCSTSCGQGVEQCLKGNWVCNAPRPSTENCDGQDNDCDGQVDENMTRNCNIVCPGEGGSSVPGTQECVNGAYTECQSDVPCPH